jgi:acetylornithine/N-succinyldiaminopimelate aminotransferase
MNVNQLQEIDNQHIMSTYSRRPLLIEKGKGCYVFDETGKKYLDFVSGIATCSVGHANPTVVRAITEQAKKLISVSNLYYTEPPIQLALTLSRLSGLKKVFFCHSGTEANEAAIKLAKKVTGKSEFIAFTEAFHGRTTGSLALTHNEKYRQPFLPLAPTVRFAQYNNAESLESLVSDNIAAVIVEPIEGEAGVIVPDEGFLTAVRQICDRHKILMIVDEVQTGLGRTGNFFAYQAEGIRPDIVTIAKGLANGLPIGACLSDYSLDIGEHGSTLGGNSLSTAAALATIGYIEKHRLIDNAAKTGTYLMKRLACLSKQGSILEAVRGKGLMIGVTLKRPIANQIVAGCQNAGLLCNAPTPNVIRLLPPLIVKRQQADECVEILTKELQP